ncbi:glycosyltransferase, partial [Halorubrum sp. SD626R]|uniref:glycosyltransferase family 4 protein n=1 Tax=Halorubrum sp. SD626R TaxID=1419722 RepID=UPI0010F5AFD4
TAGNLNESKKIEDIIRSIPNIDSDLVRLVILGSGDEEYIQSLRNLTEDLNMSDQITFYDFVAHENLSKFYNAADVGVWPGKLGITIIEAVSCGLPIIVSDTEATDFLIGNDNGVCLPVISPDKIADAIQRYAENPSRLESHGSNAYQLTQRELSWKSIAEKSIEIYKCV